jgi:hypothetical protein
MNNRFGSSSILLTASSSDFSYLLKGGTGFVKALASIKGHKKMNYKNISVLRKYRVMASANPTLVIDNLLNIERRKQG